MVKYGLAMGLALAGFVAGAATLTVDPEGALLRDGKPYRAIGVNYFDCFTRCLANSEDTSYREGFKTLAEYEVPFVRASFGGFYPVNWKLYRDDKDTYFRLMDNVVKAAEESGIGIVPSLFWAVACIPDLVGEPCNAWGKPDSKTHAFMRQYVREVVGRYKDAKVIWAWEFGNEYSLAADLPPSESTRPPTPTQFGAPATRTAEDDLTSEMIVTAFKAFAEEIRTIDPVRPITTGNATPRHSAEHLRTERSWKADSREEFVRNLALVTPDPMNMVSIHYYPGDIEKRFGAEGKSTYADVLRVCLEGAAAARKPLFIGEFGGPPDNQAPWDAESAKVEGLALLKAIEESSVPLAAIWVFDFPWQEDFINISTGNHRAHYLGAIRDANRRIKKAQSSTQGK